MVYSEIATNKETFRNSILRGYKEEMMVVRSCPQTGDEHGAGILGFLETTTLVEVHLLVIGHEYDAQVISVVRFHHFQQMSAYPHMVVFRPDQHVMDVGCHNAVVHATNKPHELVSVPSGVDGLEMLHGYYQLLGIMTG